MSFYPKTESGNLKPWEYLPAAAGTYKAGQMLNISGGKLVAISAVSKTTPAYLCMADTTVAAGENLPVAKVLPETIFVTTLSAAAAGCALGTLLEVSAGGEQVDNAAAGTFEVVYCADTAIGGEVHGRFK